MRLRRRFGLPFEPLALIGGDGTAILAHGVSGTVEVGQWSLEVAPWYSDVGDRWAADLLAMLGRAERHRFDWSASGGVTRTQIAFADHLAEAYVEALERALRHEPIRVYRTFEERSTVLRGQLNIGRQLRSVYTKPHLLECDVSRLDAHNPFNQLMVWACFRLSRRVRDDGLRRRLRALGDRLPAAMPRGIPPLVRAEPPPQYRVWREPVAIANLVASNLGHVVADTLVDGVSLCINMPDLFEKFVEASIHTAMPRLGDPRFAFFPQARAPLASPRHSPAVVFQPQPDGTIRRDGRVILVTDTKYRDLFRSEQEPHGRFHREDVYQLLASMVAHECPTGVLMYPARAPTPKHPPLAWDVNVLGQPARIHVVEVQCREVAAESGLARFDDQLAGTLRDLLSDVTVSTL